MGYDVFFWAGIVGLVLLTLIQLVSRFLDPARGIRAGVCAAALALFVTGVVTEFFQVLVVPSRPIGILDAGRFFMYLRQAVVIAGYILLPFLFRPERSE